MAGGSAQELFRDNIGSIVDPGTEILFSENIADMGIVLDPALSAHDLDAASSPNRVITARAASEAIENHDGIISGSRDGVRSGVAERVADARESKAAVSERDSERANDTAFYVMLLAENGVGGFISGQFFGGMDDDEALSFGRRMEEETGRSLEDWAEEILGPEAAERHDGESEADYIRRVGRDVLDAITDDDGDLLPEYADSAIGNFFLGEYEYQRILGEVMPQVQAARASGMTIEQAEAELRAEGVMDGGLRVEFAAAVAAEGDDQELYIALEDDRELGSDTDLGTTVDVAANASALDMFS
ncbi:hypothetical protein D9R08_17195 [Rhodophyticola porphyridii]|uniref:Uncharacterized protein n=2 Tax=Rhodophyticola porphyridii TaxID=1852017 RepID=A0A3L9Y450_9RHOB|nr:hypothetical protein D9R08_17195 [Rhodophyticola porphyridii]